MNNIKIFEEFDIEKRGVKSQPLTEKRVLMSRDIDRMIHAIIPMLDYSTTKELERAITDAIRPIIIKHGYEII